MSPDRIAGTEPAPAIPAWLLEDDVERPPALPAVEATDEDVEEAVPTMDELDAAPRAGGAL